MVVGEVWAGAGVDVGVEVGAPVDPAKGFCGVRFGVVGAFVGVVEPERDPGDGGVVPERERVENALEEFWNEGDGG